MGGGADTSFCDRRRYIAKNHKIETNELWLNKKYA